MIARQGKENDRLDTPEIERYCVPDESGAELLRKATVNLALSARRHHRTLKVARTIADLAGPERIGDSRLPHRFNTGDSGS